MGRPRRIWWLSSWDLTREPPTGMHRAVGCAQCGGTGYRGRTAIHEVMLLSEEIDRLIVGRRQLGRHPPSRAGAGHGAVAPGRPRQGRTRQHNARGGLTCRRLMASAGSNRPNSVRRRRRSPPCSRSTRGASVCCPLRWTTRASCSPSRVHRSGSVVAEIAMATAKNVVPVLADRALCRAQPTPDPAVSLTPPAATPSARRRHAHIDELLGHLLDAGGSDLHLSAGAPPSIRVHGTLRPLDGLRRARRRDDRAARVPHHRRGSPAILLGGARARRRLLDAGPQPLPDERVPPARLRRRRAPCHSVQDPRLRHASACRRS